MKKYILISVLIIGQAINSFGWVTSCQGYVDALCNSGFGGGCNTFSNPTTGYIRWGVDCHNNIGSPCARRWCGDGFSGTAAILDINYTTAKNETNLTLSTTNTKITSATTGPDPVHNYGNYLLINIRMCQADSISFRDIFQDLGIVKTNGGVIPLSNCSFGSYYFESAATSPNIFNIAPQKLLGNLNGNATYPIYDYIFRGKDQSITATTTTYNLEGVFMYAQQNTQLRRLRIWITIQIDKSPTQAQMDGVISGLGTEYCTSAAAVDLTTINSTGSWKVNNVSTNTFNPSSYFAMSTVPVAFTGTYNTCVYTNTKNVGILRAPTANVAVYSQPANVQMNPINPYIICPGDSVRFAPTINFGTPPITYSWTDTYGALNNAASSNPIVRLNGGNNSYTFPLTITDSKGCVGASTFNISTYNSINVTVSKSIDSICAGGSKLVTTTLTGGNGAAIYSWLPTSGLSAVNTSSVTMSPSNTTPYVVTVTDTKGCKDTARALLKVNPVPSGTITSSVSTIALNGSVQFYVSTIGSSYNWNFGDQTFSIEHQPWHFYYDTSSVGFDVSVVVTDSKGCVGTITKNKAVIVTGNMPGFVTSNQSKSNPENIDFTVSPNPSDYFFTLNLINVPSATLEIYDLTGQKHYQVQLMEQSTFINMNEINLIPGTYVCKVSTDKSLTSKLLIKQ